MKSPLHRLMGGALTFSSSWKDRQWKMPSLGWLAALLLLAVYSWCLIPIYLAAGYTPDEVWFHNIALRAASHLKEVNPVEFFLTQENTLGYGSVYWACYATACWLPVNELTVMRVLSLSCVLSIPLCLYKCGSQFKSSFGWASVLIWLTTPMAWWMNKLTGPELYSVALGVWGIYFWIKPNGVRPILGSLLLGLSLGVKPIALPVICFAATYSVFRPRRVRSFIVLVAGSAIGQVLANPFLLPGNMSTYFENLTESGGAISADPIQHLQLIFLHQGVYVDGVWNAGFMGFGLSLASGILFLAMLLGGRASWAYLSALLVALLSTVAIMLATMSFKGWYWFPFISVVALGPSLLPQAMTGSYRPMAILILLAVGANACSQIPVIQDRLFWKRHHIASVQQESQIERTVEVVTRQSMDSLLMLVDFTYHDLNIESQSLPMYRPFMAPEWLRERISDGACRTFPIAVIVSHGYQQEGGAYQAFFSPRTEDNPVGYEKCLHHNSFVSIYQYRILDSPELRELVRSRTKVFDQTFRERYLIKNSTD